MTDARRLEYVPLSGVEPAKRNPKRHAGDGIRRSLAKFGVGEAPLLDERTGRLVAGHGRIEQLQAMRERGEDPPEGITVSKSGEWLVPVIRGWSSRSDSEAEAYLLASNQLTVAGGWNDEELADVLGEISEADLLDVTGFADEDLAKLLGDDTDADPGDGLDHGYQPVFEVAVTCKDETEQEIVYQLLTEKGYKCRVLSM